MTTTNAPTATYDLSGVWTGTKMIVWGGYTGSAAVNSGGIYDPITNSWSATTSTNAPSIRYHHAAQWTGTKMIVWGGNGPLNTGALYNLSDDSWSATTTTNAPTARETPATVWTGSKLIVFSGNTQTNSGGIYDPSTDTWSATTSTNAPEARKVPCRAWNGSSALFFGGYTNINLNYGALYNPTTNSWTAVTTTGPPAATASGADSNWNSNCVWTGAKFIVWGGCDRNNNATNAGGLYDVSTNSWSMTTSTNAASYAIGSYSVPVWSGTRLIASHGIPSGNCSAAVGHTSLFNPVNDSWFTATSTGAPGNRGRHVNLWNGSRLLVFGGLSDGCVAINSGGLYSPP